MEVRVDTREDAILATLFTVAIVGTIWVAMKVWQILDGLKYFEKKNLPYKKPLPIFGNMWPLLTKELSLLELTLEMYREYPETKYSGIFEYSEPIYLLRDPDIIKFVTVKHFNQCPDHKGFVDESVDPFFGGHLAVMKGERWKEMRSIVSPLFTTSKMRSMFELMAKCAEDFAKHMMKQPLPLTLEIRDAFARYTNDVIATTAFGVSVNSLEESDNEFYVMGKDVTSFEGERLLKLMLFAWAPRLMKFFGQQILPAKTAGFFRDLVKNAVEIRRREGIRRPDLIHLLMKAKHKDTGDVLTLDEMTSQGFIFFFAGFDTSSALPSFVSYILAVHRDIQDRLIAEIDAAFEKDNGKLSYETLNQLEYFDMVLNETLRYYPPSGFTDRIVTREFELPPTDESSPPILLRPGDRVWILIHALHHDPRYFPDPETFDPERFNPKNQDKVNLSAFLPFGIGPRNCPAKRFALLETKLVLCHLLRKFHLRTCEKTQVPLVLDSSGPSLSSKHGFWLTLEPRAAVN